MPRRLLLMLALAAGPTQAQEADVSPEPAGVPGSAAQLVLAQRLHDLALQTGDPTALIAAIALARRVTLRPATGWEKTTTAEAPADAPAGASAAPDPAGEAALTVARNLAGEDPDLQDLVYGLDAQHPGGQARTAVFARSDVAPGRSDDWRLPLFGQVAAEIAVIGDGDGPLTLAVRDESGAVLCVAAPSARAALCRLTPARNGFFTVTVQNPGTTVNSYRLVGN